jgi:hypothetical protein
MGAERWNINYTWTQPYTVSMNPFYNTLTVAHELQRLDDIDRAVQMMLTYPDAERIINKIRQQGDQQ